MKNYILLAITLFITFGFLLFLVLAQKVSADDPEPEWDVQHEVQLMPGCEPGQIVKWDGSFGVFVCEGEPESKANWFSVLGPLLLTLAVGLVLGSLLHHREYCEDHPLRPPKDLQP